MPIRITFDNPIDFNDHFSTPKDLKKDLAVTFDSIESSILPPPLLDSDSPFTAELSASITLNSLRKKEDKFFKIGAFLFEVMDDIQVVKNTHGKLNVTQAPYWPFTKGMAHVDFGESTKGHVPFAVTVQVFVFLFSNMFCVFLFLYAWCGGFTLPITLPSGTQVVTYKDCQAGNPWCNICDPTAMINLAMIGGIDGRDCQELITLTLKIS
ncbi:hypothetical protein Tco_0911105 [Tanacetum coccineum]|uniref:Uncharacterized protein n=1 Tax=Tanacetum coccineum TaxID=301880 RepID=A0ABQ5CUT8_9ASTR